MAITIPAGSKTISDKRLDLIRLVSDLHAKLVELKDVGLKAKLKEVMKAKKVNYAESDLCIARKSDGPTHGNIDPIKFYKMFKTGEIEEKDFLSAISVSKDKAKVFLPERAVEKLCPEIPAKDRSSSVTIEWRPEVDIDLDQMAAKIVDVLFDSLSEKSGPPEPKPLPLAS